MFFRRFDAKCQMAGGFVLLVCGLAVGRNEAVDEKRISDIASMLCEQPRGVGLPCTKRQAWDKLAKHGSFGKVISKAEGLLTEPIPEQSDELYLEFSRTGNRTNWQRIARQRRAGVDTLSLAECLENKGRFTVALEKLVQELCSERTWMYPAHDKELVNFNGTRVDIDLASSRLGWSLATADYLLAEKLSNETRQMIRENLERRIFAPFEDMVRGRREKNWWLSTTNNWNAVCLAGVTGSALTMVESRQRRAFFVAAGEKYSENFLAGFTEYGYCSEGLGYWNYGFGRYVMLSEAIHQATNGKLDVLARPKVREAASFGAHIEIINGTYPAFADCRIDARPSSRLMYFPWEQADPASGSGSLLESMIYSFANSASRATASDSTSELPSLRTWFSEAGVLICRPGPNSSCRLGVALKGGHNAEHHNHNDVGSFVVVLADKPLLLDPGSEVYTRRTFSNRRYQSNVLNSFGHPVPVVAGKLQRSGSAARGRVVHKSITGDTDSLVLDISSAYDVPEMEKLTRSFVYCRTGAGSLVVTDEAVFTRPSDFGTALITFSTWEKTSPSSLVIYEGQERLRVDIKVDGAGPDIRPETIDEDVRAPKKPTRLGINLTEPVTHTTVTATITPIE
ncbi:MAG: heparinase II/III family protein [Planctomycetota bacterium]|jgi:hypothetical protein